MYQHILIKLLLLNISLTYKSHVSGIFQKDNLSLLMELWPSKNTEYACTDDTHNRTCCEVNEFRCLRGDCIPNHKVCDFNIDGKSIYEEDGTMNLKTDRTSQISMNHDCSDGSDEMGCYGAPCSSIRDQCQQLCMDLPGNKSKCICYRGYKLEKVDNMFQCTDIDECSIATDFCTHSCINLEGSYRCKCKDNYVLDVNNNCKAIDRDILVFFNSGPWIFYYDVGKDRIQPFWKSIYTEDIDYDPIDNILYWSGENKVSIYNPLNGNLTDKEISLVSTVMWQEPITNSLCVDWFTRNIYWISKDVLNNSRIMVSGHYGKLIKTLIVENEELIESISNLVIDPEKGVMYWILNYDKYGQISTAWMDGQHNKYVHRFWNHFPTVLSIDHTPERKLYWLDSISSSIYSSYVDGSGLAKVVSTSRGERPIKFDIFENFIYWATEGTNELVRRDKFGRGKVEGLIVGITKPSAIKVFHSSKINVNTERNISDCSHCEHICLNSPNGFRCSCPDGSSTYIRKNITHCFGEEFFKPSEQSINCNCDSLNCINPTNILCCYHCDDMDANNDVMTLLRKSNTYSKYQDKSAGVNKIPYELLISSVIIAFLL